MAKVRTKKRLVALFEGSHDQLVCRGTPVEKYSTKAWDRGSQPGCRDTLVLGVLPNVPDKCK